MKWIKALALALLGGAWLGISAQAQSTNAVQTDNVVRTDIETLEAQTNVVIVKGFGTGGIVSIAGGVIGVHVKESYSPGANDRLQALVLDFDESGPHQRAVIDYAEIESLLKSLDYIRSATYDVTGLPGFEVDYRTKDGFRVIGLGSHRQSSVQTFVQFEGCQRIPLNSDQMSQLRGVIAQARNALDELKSGK